MPLGKRTDYGDAKFAGVEIAFSTAVEAAVQVGDCCRLVPRTVTPDLYNIWVRHDSDLVLGGVVHRSTS